MPVGVLSLLTLFNRDDEVVREYYTKMIQRFVLATLDEMSALHMEVDMLRHMANMPNMPPQ